MQRYFDANGDPHPCRVECQLTSARAMVGEAQKIMETAARLAGRTVDGEIMSNALWCDQGSHAFSARDPKAEHWERNGTDAATGKKVTIPWDVCGEHMDAINGRLAALEQEVNGPAQIPGNVSG